MGFAGGEPPSLCRWRFPLQLRLPDHDLLRGYDAIVRGPEAIQRYFDLTGVDLLFDPQLLGESASNTGVFFNATYDATDRLAVTVEGRYQNDEVSGTDTTSGNSGSVLTKAFVPRLSFNYNVNDSTSVYGQFARGNNPAGVNVGFFNPAIAATLHRATQLWEDTNGAEGVPYSVETVINFDEEQLTNLEFGIKGAALDGRLQYASAIYFMEWEGNVSQSTCIGGISRSRADNGIPWKPTVPS